MARIRLSFLERRRLVVVPPNDALTLFLRKPICVAHVLGSSGRFVRQAVIDTGSPLSIIPERVWRHDDFPLASVRWTVGAGDRQIVTVPGRAFDCRIGVVSVQAVSPTAAATLAPVDVVAQFTHDGDAFGHVIMGLRHGILDGRRFVVEADANFAYLEDR